MGDPLIRTKLSPPRVSSRLLGRPRLLAQLGEWPERRLTLVVAPAGFGKTTVVIQWLAQGGTPYTWLSLDQDDNTVERCWRYLVAAVRRVYPTGCPETAALLEAQHLPPARYLADTLANDLAELPGPLVLVLDDFHQLGGQEVHDALTRLVAHLPESVHIVVISRTTPPWAVGRLRGQGQLVELRAAELRFTTTEARALLQESLASGPLDEVADLLCTRTEGWAVGLQLAWLSLRAAPDVRALAQGIRGTSRHIADYLLDEVLGHQPEALQRVLLVSALPERFCPELCAHLLEGQPLAAARATIAEIERQGLFLVPLDDEQIWYRYHHLVRELLTFRLSEVVGKEGVVALHRRCSDWFAAQGLIEEAVHHALQVGDLPLAARLVEESYSVLLEREDGLVRLAPVLALLPETVIASRPRLLLAQAFDCFIRWDFAALPVLVERVMARLAVIDPGRMAEEGMDLRGDIALLQGMIGVWNGHFARAVAQLAEAYRRIPRTRPNTHALAAMNYGVAMFHNGDSDSAFAFMREEMRQVGALTSTTGATFLIGLGYIGILGGQFGQLARDTKQLLDGRSGQNRFVQCWGNYLLGRYHYERDELDTAEGCFLQASSYPFNAQERVHHDSLIALARIALARGELDRAVDYTRAGRVFAEERANPELIEPSVSFEAWLALVQGNQVAASWLSQTIDPTIYTGNAIWLEQARACRAAVQIAQATAASLTEAAANLARYLAEAEAAHNLYWQIRVSGLLALAHEAQGEGEAALTALGRAVALAAPRGFVRSLVDCGPLLAALLCRLLPGNPNRAYITHVLTLLGAGPALAPSVAGDAHQQVAAPTAAPALLTEREQEIMRLLAERLTDHEIAERLIISVTTVRTHARNIYAKLEVGNRREAIGRARALGLLPG